MRGSFEKPRFARWVIVAIAALSLAVIAGGYWFYRDQNQSARRTAQQELASIAQLKASQIVQWRADRLGDAGVISGTSFTGEVVSRWLETGQEAEKEQILAWLQLVRDRHHYSAAVLVDPTGTPLLVSEGDEGALTQIGMSGVQAAMASGAPLLTDLHVDVDGTIHIDAIAPNAAGCWNVLSTL